MKRYLLKIVSALLTGVMLVGTAVPAMADISDIQVIDLAAETTTPDYDKKDNGEIKIYIVEDGKRLPEEIDTSKINFKDMVQIKAEPERDNMKFAYFQYVTPARSYVASYDSTFTFYADPPMTIEAVYTSDTQSVQKNIVSGMYKAPESDGTNTYFYCCVTGGTNDIRANETTANITFGRSQMAADDGKNSETFNTSAEQNIYNNEAETSAPSTFQYIVSSGIKVGGPINFDAKVNGSTAQIKTWDFSTGAFYNIGTKGTINGLNFSNVTKNTDSINLTDGSKLSFSANAGDKIRVYADGRSTLTVNGATESKHSTDNTIIEYIAGVDTVDISGTGNITKIMLNPMDIAISDSGDVESPKPEAATTGTIKVTVKSNSTVNSEALLSGATVTAKMEPNSVTIPETGEGIYSVSAPAGVYSINVELNGQTAEGSATVENGETAAVDIYIKDIEAERQDKIDELINNLKDTDSKNGSVWNKENDTEQKWSYINGCMITAFMDLYEVTNNTEYYDNSLEYQSSFLNDSGVPLKNNGSSTNPLTSDSTLDNINPGKSLLDLIELDQKNIKKLSDVNKTKFTNCVNEQISNGILKNVKRINIGNFWHKAVYNKQVWLDGTYMALPYMIQYKRVLPDYNIAGKSTTLDDVIKDIVNQFTNIEEKMKNTDTGLYYHGYDAHADNSNTTDYNIEEAMSWARNSDDPTATGNYKVGTGKASTAKNDGCSSNYWSRAMGWYAMALIDSIEQIKLADPQLEKYQIEVTKLSQIFKDLMNSILKYQYELDENGNPTENKGNGQGLWYQVTDNPQDPNNYNYIESSGSATFAAALMKGYNLGVLDETYYDKGLNAFNALTDHKLENGGLKDICITAGFGGYDSSGSSGHTSKSAGQETGRGRGPRYSYRDGSYEYYVSEETVENDAKGAAPYLMAYAQKLQHDKVAAGN